MHFRSINIIIILLLLVHIAAPPLMTGQEKKPYSIEEVEKLIKSKVVSDERIVELLYENGLNFYPDDETIARLKRAGASNEVIEAIRTAEHPPPPEPVVQEEEKEKKPFYKKWWVMGAAALVVGGLVAIVASGGGDDEAKPLPGFPNPPGKR